MWRADRSTRRGLGAGSRLVFLPPAAGAARGCLCPALSSLAPVMRTRTATSIQPSATCCTTRFPWRTVADLLGRAPDRRGLAGSWIGCSRIADPSGPAAVAASAVRARRPKPVASLHHAKESAGGQ
ncbi:hypothetical protein EJB05_01246 [Eragrostis curvula]|uniref:Uncharacterized protein n=1 Tax=Eragrostis curvula TaxID=38414 RepID=A0A5J9WRH6_9POAL|nr:hypothetical protein EJB05_01246 [Eragrostis curvula]